MADAVVFWRFRRVAVPLLLAGSLMVPTAAPARQEGPPKPVIGVVDLPKVMSASGAAKAIKAQRDAFMTRYHNETAEKEEAFQAESKALMSLRAAAASKQFNARRDMFREKIAAFATKVQTRRSNLERAFGRAWSQLKAKVLQIVDMVAARRGMNLVVSRSQVVLFDPDVDITDEVLATLDEQTLDITMVDPDSFHDRGTQ